MWSRKRRKSTPLARIRDSHAEFLPIEGRAARDGDYAIVDVADRFVEVESPILYTADGSTIADEKAGEWHRDEKVTLEVGHPDSMPEINDALRGASPGETRPFRKTFPPDFPNAKYAGKTVDYEVTLVALKEKKLPELDDAFAAHVAAGLALSELKVKIAESLRAEKEAGRRRKFQRELLDNLVSRVPAVPPEALIEAEVESALEEYAGYLSAGGMDPKDADWDKLARDARPGAERRVKEYLVLDEIARREALPVTDTEVDAEIKASAERRRVEFAPLKERLAREGRIGSVRQEIRLQKAVTWLIDHARIEKCAGRDLLMNSSCHRFAPTTEEEGGGGSVLVPMVIEQTSRGERAYDIYSRPRGTRDHPRRRSATLPVSHRLLLPRGGKPREGHHALYHPRAVR
jgi:trigger factor